MESEAARKQRFTVAITLIVVGVIALGAAVMLHLTQGLRVSLGELSAREAYALGIRSGARVALAAVVGFGLVGIGISGIGGAQPLRQVRQALAVSVTVAVVALAMGMWNVFLGAAVATLIGVWFQRRVQAKRMQLRAASHLSPAPRTRAEETSSPERSSSEVSSTEGSATDASTAASPSSASPDDT